MPLLNANAANVSAATKSGCVAGCAVLPLVPGALGQTVAGFMTFSAVMLLKCLSSTSRSPPAVDDTSMAAPTGKFTTPYRAARLVLRGGALAGGGNPPPPPPPPLTGGGVSPPPPQAISRIASAAPTVARIAA